ncbi:ABC transporter permease [Myroides phaeus]|nr:ABC transporter permease [Myroides phaeus]MEC4116611.1 ABC transporter permease [Myroides phaeus]
MKKGFWSIFKGECTRIFTSPRLLVLMLGVPLILFIYYASLLGKGVSRDLPITLLDLDKSNLSRQFARTLESTSTMKIAYEVADEVEGQKTVRKGESFAMVIIPKDFQKNVQKSVYTNITCYYNGQYLLPAGLILRDFQLTAGIFAAGARVQVLQQGGAMLEQAVTMVSPVGTDSHVLYNPYTSYEYYLTIAFMPMAFQIVIMVVSIYAFGSVLRYRKGRELLVQGNGNIFTIILGKILPYTIVFSIIGFFMNTLLYYKIGIPFQGSFFVINLFFISFIVVCQSMAFFLASVMFSMRTALTIGGSYAALAFSFAGYTFPPEGMSAFIRGFNYIFPFHAYLRFIVDYAVRGFAYNSVQQTYVITLAVFVCVGIIGIPFYYNKLKRGGYNV